MRTPFLVVALLCGLAATAQAQNDTLYVKRAAELRQGPGDSTPVVLPLAAQAAVTRLPERQGPWMRVKAEGGQTGWIHMFDVGTAPSTSSSSAGNTAGNALRSLGSLFSRSNSQTTTATSTVGIRGLGAEDIANAAPNMQALVQIEGQRADAQQARRFAAESQLTARAVEPLPAVQPPSASSNSGGPVDPEMSGRKGGSK